MRKFDTRSAQINEELDVTVLDEKFGAEMESIFAADLKRARLYSLEEFRKRGVWERLSEWVVMPLRSQL